MSKPALRELLIKRIEITSKRQQADLVIKNGKIIDVFSLEIIEEDLAIADGYVVGIGQFEGKREIDADGAYICPGLIDAHVHIESSMVTPEEFAEVVVPHGVTAVITDPHEIANVSGTKGLQFMLENSEGLPLDVFVMLPSCVPATPFEHNGAELTSEELQPFFSHPRVLGLAEVMDYPSLKNADDSILDKVVSTHQKGGHLDGHLAGLDTDAVNLYTSVGITTDHESTTIEEARDRLRRGMYLLIREGSVAKDLKALIEVVTYKNARRCAFCTDDKHLDDLIEEGSIDHSIRLAIESGLDPLLAIQMATLTVAECYGLKGKGALAPGYQADFVLLDDLDSFSIKEVYKAGELVARDGQFLSDRSKADLTPEQPMQSVHVPPFSVKDLEIAMGGSRQARIIEIIPNQIVTRSCVEEVDVEGGYFLPSVKKDQLKLAVIERHKQTGHIGVGIVKGFGIQSGALATTIAHDSHNIVAVGTDDEDLLIAVKALHDIGGGLVIVNKGVVLASLSLPIAGLMSDQPYLTVYEDLKKLNHRLIDVGFHGAFNPFLTLSFLTLPVIPSLKLTDMGLFDVTTMEHVSVSV